VIPHAGKLRWKEQRFIFEISSPHAELLEHAARVFPARPAEPGIPADLSWHLDDPEERDSALLKIEVDALEFLLRNNPDTVAVHAALLSKDGKGVVIAGPSLAGKSTLATALWQTGWSLMADDLVFIDARTRTAIAAPRRVSLRSESMTLVGETLWNEIQHTPSCIRTAKGLFFHPHEVTGAPRLDSTSVSGIFFLARRGVSVGDAETNLMNPAKAALALLPYGYNVRDLPFMEALSRLSPIVSAMPVWDLGRGNLDEMVAAVERKIG
jgi:hypothetical protein